MLQFLTQFDDIRLILVLSIALCLVLLISFSMHEFGHAYIAFKCGDPTAKALGRLTLNPFSHIDGFGFMCCMLFGFGWAKPVPINPIHFKKYKTGIVLTSLAGVLINLILSFLGCGFLYLFLFTIATTITNQYLFYLLYYVCYFMFTINLSLLIFNLLPIPPLDGFNVLSAITKYNNKFVDFMKRYGTIILFVMLFVFDGWLIQLINLIGTPIELFWSWIFSLF